MSLTAWERLLLRENLFWAWHKAASLYSRSEGLHDQSEISAFDLDLEANLDAIRKDFIAGTYKLRSVVLLPQPKSPDGDNHRMRQSFYVSVRDQVAWIAVVNAIGPALDFQMPPWSYGHRLHRSAWVPDSWEEDQSTRIGPYRHSSAQLFRNFRQSWPLYRRHIILTARQLGHGTIREEELDEGERRALKAERSPFNPTKLPYLSPGYFANAGNATGDVFYASSDLAQFYPSIPTDVVLREIRRYSNEVTLEPRLSALIEQMLTFTVTTAGLSRKMRRCDPRTRSGPFDGIPTGLMVAGFLSNVAMLGVDKQVSQEIPYKGIAHFRFVDDHTFIAPSFDALLDWIDRYKQILSTHIERVRVNEDKYQPDELKAFLNTGSRISPTRRAHLMRNAQDACKVDPAYPRPLLTRTLAQLSLLGSVDFDTLDDEGQNSQIEQIVTLMLTALPDTELREDTRKTYAAARLTALVPKLRENVDEWASKSRELDNVREQRKRAEDQLHGPADPRIQASQQFISLQELIAQLEENETALRVEVRALEERVLRQRAFTHRRAFELLFEAFSEHPHKGRLLELLFRFCAATGYQGLGAIFSKISDLQSQYYPLGTYLKASAFHVLGYLVTRAAVGIANHHASERVRGAYRAFLHDCIALNPEHLRCDPEYFSIFAKSLLSVGAITAAFKLEQLSADDREAGTQLIRVTSDKADVSALSYADHFYDVTKDQLAGWLFWADGITAPKESTEPSPQWIALSARLTPTKKLDWNVLRKYPKALPANALSSLRTNSRNFDRLDEGWLYDALRGRTDPVEIPRKLIRVRRAVDQPPGRADLVAWAQFAANLSSHDPFDPRASEWTALEILKQVLIDIETFSLKPRTGLCHPSNFTVPTNWLLTPLDPWRRASKIWTWESWRNFCRQPNSVSSRALSSVISDYRYRDSSDASPTDAQRAELIAYGLLLFGLLRRSFQWPALWNVRGQERAHVWLAGMEAQKLAISTNTLAILDGLLKPRSWESVLLYETAPGFAGFPTSEDVTRSVARDTALDVASLTAPSQIREHIDTAQAALEAGQVAGFENRPRQLVPVDIRRLAATHIAGHPQGDDE